MIYIATILTCFNRREKTVKCLKHLFAAQDAYNAHALENIRLSVYLTDDACTDGTVEAVREVCKGKDLEIIQGNGNLYWAGGMRIAWREAQKRHEEWDFYLLLNDDTIVINNVFDELMECHNYAISHHGKQGVYSGCTCDENKTDRITYSGDIMNPHTKGWARLVPNGTPQMVDMTNANILLIDKSVVDTIGIFPDGYIHSAADQDYGMMANRAGLPVLITSHICGYCEYDHLEDSKLCKKLMTMSLKERKLYVSNPLHSDKDYLLFIKRNMPNRYIISYILRAIRLYFPAFYYKINKLRGLY